MVAFQAAIDPATAASRFIRFLLPHDCIAFVGVCRRSDPRSGCAISNNCPTVGQARVDPSTADTRGHDDG
jgi:hypothetical protein